MRSQTSPIVPNLMLLLLPLLPPQSFSSVGSDSSQCQRWDRTLHSAPMRRRRPKRKSCSSQEELGEEAWRRSRILGVFLLLPATPAVSQNSQLALPPLIWQECQTSCVNESESWRFQTPCFLICDKLAEREGEKRNGRETKDGTSLPRQSLIYTFPCCSMSRDILLTETGDPPSVISHSAQAAVHGGKRSDWNGNICLLIQ